MGREEEGTGGRARHPVHPAPKCSPGPRPSALMHADERENQSAGAGRGRLGFGDRGVDRSVACTAAVRPNRANVRGRAPSVTRQRRAGQMYPLQWDPTTDAMIARLPRYACGHQRRLQAPQAMHEPTRQPIGEGRQRAAPPRRRSSCPPTGSQRRHAPPPPAAIRVGTRTSISRSIGALLTTNMAHTDRNTLRAAWCSS